MAYHLKGSYRHNVQQDGSTLSLIVGKKVIWELVDRWEERKCQSHHTSGAWLWGMHVPTGPCDFMMGDPSGVYARGVLLVQ